MPRVAIQRKNVPVAGISGTISSPEARTSAMVADEGARPSAIDAWMPAPASWRATGTAMRAGTLTISPTSGALVCTWRTAVTRIRTLAKPVISSVESVHVPITATSAAGSPKATARTRQRGSARTRRGAPSTTSAAPGGGASAAGAHASPFSVPARKLARTCSASSSVSSARRTSSSFAIAQVFNRA